MNEASNEASTAAGPPVVWRNWPGNLERAARAAARRPLPSWVLAFSNALTRWSVRIEQNPARAYGLGAALAFALGVLVGLL
ncbi:MAG TPA: hypothetical protein VFU02_14335 [Polyangiaceae bacterium]|nr:hypothetical protein [Polyangiaceae bacterium]